MSEITAPSYSRIVVPLDGSAFAETVLPHVVSLAQRYGARVTLVRAYGLPASVTAATIASAMPGTGPVVDPTPYIEAEEGEAESYLEGACERLRALGIESDCHDESGSAGEEIVELAQEIGADLIAMATHARGGLGRIFGGGVSDYVVQHAPCPVLLVHPPER